MWVKDFEGSLVNLSFARSVFISGEDDEWQVITEFNPDKTSGRTVLYEGDKDHCQAYLQELQRRLVPATPYSPRSML